MNEEFDFEKFDAEWAQEEAEELESEAGEGETVEGDEDLEQEQEQDEPEADVQTLDEEDPQDAQETPDLSAEQERNAAFAKLRRERDEAAKQASFLQKLADDNGMTVEEIVQRYENARLEEEAEETQVPVEVLQRLKHLESENEAIKSQNFTARFNSEVESTIKKYNASEEDVKKTFEYAHENGLTELLKSGSTTFEAAHKLAHMDTMIEKQVQSAIQDSLSKKKKRQQDAPLSHGSAADYTVESLEDQAVSDAKKILANW